MVYTFIAGTTEKQRQFAAKKILEFIHNIILNDLPLINVLYLGRGDADFVVNEILPMLPAGVRLVATDICVATLYSAMIMYSYLLPWLSFQHFDLYNKNSNPFQGEKFSCVISVWYSHIPDNEIPRIRTEYMTEQGALLRIRDPHHTLHRYLSLVLTIVNGGGMYLSRPPPLLSHNIRDMNRNYELRLQQQRQIDQQYENMARKEICKRCEWSDVISLRENLGRQFVLDILIPQEANLPFYIFLYYALWLHYTQGTFTEWEYYTIDTLVETIFYGPQPAQWENLFDREGFY